MNSTEKKSSTAASHILISNINLFIIIISNILFSNKIIYQFLLCQMEK